MIKSHPKKVGIKPLSLPQNLSKVKLMRFDKQVIVKHVLTTSSTIFYKEPTRGENGIETLHDGSEVSRTQVKISLFVTTQVQDIDTLSRLSFIYINFNPSTPLAGGHENLLDFLP